MRKAGLLMTILMMALIWGCTQQKSSSDIETTFLTDFEQQFEKLEPAYALEQWKRITGDKSAEPYQYTRAYNAFLSDVAMFEKARLARQTMPDGVELRLLDIVYRTLLANQIDHQPEIAALSDSLSRLFLRRGDRTRLQGTFLYASKRSNRERAYAEYDRIGGELTDGVARLIRLRNLAASRLGYKSYYSMQMSAQGIDPLFLDSLCFDLEMATRGIYTNILNDIKTELGVDTLNVWDLWVGAPSLPFAIDSLLRGDNQETLLRATLRDIGFDLANMPIYFFFDYFPEARRAVELHVIHYPDDIRILADLTDGFASLEHLMRAGGSAIYAASIDQEEYLLRRSPADCWTEAMAGFYSLLVREDAWLEQYLGLTDRQIAEWRGYFDREAVISMRMLLLRTMFERELYRDVYRAPEQVYAQLMEQIMLLPADQYRHVWAAGADHFFRPLYAHNYLLGELIAAQMYHHIRQDSEKIAANKAVRHYLVQNFYRFGRRHDWPHILEWATGEKLNPQYWLERVSAAELP
ncbi:MAG: hypothetical protein JW763_10725 [candidate division Zixibacteria bacterium]|nr:hypothetical protein [candidate division Zixibacteria bacterium]